MNNYIYIDKRIEKNSKIIFGLTIAATVMSVILDIVSVVIDLYGEMWKGVEFNKNVGRFCALLYVVFAPLWSHSFSYSILNKIDCVRIYQCVNVKTQEDIDHVKIRMLDSWDKIRICSPIILDVAVALFIGIGAGLYSLNSGLLLRVFTECLLAFLIAHLLSYVTIIFYILSCSVKRKELAIQLPDYINDKKKEIQQKQKEMLEKKKAEKIANDKIEVQKLLEQCGMKFFIKYFNQIKTLPLRDVEVEENCEPAERTERLQATKAIIDSGYSAIARDYILQNYVDILSEEEIQQLKSIS